MFSNLSSSVDKAVVEKIHSLYSKDTDLEKIFQEKTEEIVIPQIMPYFENDIFNIKTYHEETYKHSIRVAILSSEIGELLGLDKKLLFYAGALHDYGKLKIDKKTLNKMSNFSKEDYEKMEKHPLYGYGSIQKHFHITALVVLRHHDYGDHSYFHEELPLCLDINPKLWDMIHIHARFVALMDFYDAITTRKNDKYGGRPLNRRRKKKIILMENSDLKKLIKSLYKNKLFT